MRRLTLILGCNVFLLVLCATLAQAADEPSRQLIDAVAQVESGNDPNAVGDRGEAVGLLQIHRCVVDDVNAILGAHRYRYDDRRDPDKSREMFRIYTLYWVSKKQLLRCDEFCAKVWHCGPSGAHTFEAKQYWDKVRHVMEEAARNGKVYE